jgi:hypothetical protein
MLYRHLPPTGPISISCRQNRSWIPGVREQDLSDEFPSYHCGNCKRTAGIGEA